jgi:hypothetical protein
LDRLEETRNLSSLEKCLRNLTKGHLSPKNLIGLLTGGNGLRSKTALLVTTTLVTSISAPPGAFRRTKSKP